MSSCVVEVKEWQAIGEGARRPCEVERVRASGRGRGDAIIIVVVEQKGVTQKRERVAQKMVVKREEEVATQTERGIDKEAAIASFSSRSRPGRLDTRLHFTSLTRDVTGQGPRAVGPRLAHLGSQSHVQLL